MKFLENSTPLHNSVENSLFGLSSSVLKLTINWTGGDPQVTSSHAKNTLTKFCHFHAHKHMSACVSRLRPYVRTGTLVAVR